MRGDIGKLTRQTIGWLLALVFMWMGTAGFIRVNSQLNVSEDGTVKIETKMLVLKKFKKNLDVMRANLQKQDSNIVFEPVSEGEYSGYVIRTGTAAYFSAIDGFIASYNGKGYSQKSEGLFSETYTISVVFPSSEKLKQGTRKDPLMRRHPPRYKLTVNLPCAAEMHNADQSSNGDKTLFWDLSPTIVGEMREVKVVFTLWNKRRIVIAVGSAVVMLLIFISLFSALQRSGGVVEEEPDVALDQGFIDSQFKTLTGMERYEGDSSDYRY